MATATTKISDPNIYGLTQFVREVQKEFFPELDDEVLYLQTLGYLGAIHARILQNSIISAAEYGNEAIITKAKLDRTILTNAVTYGISDINATPAKMEAFIEIPQVEMEKCMDTDNPNKFTLCCDIPFMVENYEFRLDYDIVIQRKKGLDGEYAYTARYDIGRANPVSDITLPYLQPPVIYTDSGNTMLVLTCVLHQVREERIYKKFTTNNILDNKTVDFGITEQLAAFDVRVTEKGVTRDITPIFEGVKLPTDELYCYYYFLDRDNIRIKFDRNSYEPRTNCDIEIIVKLTEGEEGNFQYKDGILVPLESQNKAYGSMMVKLAIIGETKFGAQRKDVAELQKMIPKEILARGTIINNRSLENFFDIFEQNRLLLYRKRDNQVERLYYAYMLIKDSMQNVIPTNTLSLEISQSEFTDSIPEDGRYFLQPGTLLSMKDIDTAIIQSTVPSDIQELEDTQFYYTSPLMICVNKVPLSVSYYMNNMNVTYNFTFSYINDNCFIQFLATTMTLRRNYLESPNYNFTMTVIPNVNENFNLIEVKDEGYGEFISKKDVRAIIVLTTADGYSYYKEGNIASFDTDTLAIGLKFEIETDSILNVDNRIRLNNIGTIGAHMTHAYVPREVSASVYILAKFDREYGRGIIDGLIPTGLTGWSLCNVYTTNVNVELYYNYSEAVNSRIGIEDQSGDDIRYFIKEVPLCRYSYITDPSRYMELLEYIQLRKAYIDEALTILEDSFAIDLKFFNTYGPSKTFRIGHTHELINSVNVYLKFKIKFVPTAKPPEILPKILQEIKDYVENLNEIGSIHMTNLTTDITNKFVEDIEFIEFYGINEYNALYQYLEREESEEITEVPEFICIHLKNNVTPSIELVLV